MVVFFVQMISSYSLIIAAGSSSFSIAKQNTTATKKAVIRLLNLPNHCLFCLSLPCKIIKYILGFTSQVLVVHIKLTRKRTVIV